MLRSGGRVGREGTLTGALALAKVRWPARPAAKRIGFGLVTPVGYSWPTMPKESRKQHRRSFLKAVSTASAGVVFAGSAPAVLAADTPAIGPVPKRKFGWPARPAAKRIGFGLVTPVGYSWPTMPKESHGSH